jgi:hypothetical protein
MELQVNNATRISIFQESRNCDFNRESLRSRLIYGSLISSPYQSFEDCNMEMSK